MQSWKKCNVPSRLLIQWLCGNSCTWALDVRLHITGTNELKRSTSLCLSLLSKKR